MPIITQHPCYICTDCNAQADTPKECCGAPMAESPDKFITRSTATPEEIVESEKAQAQEKLDAEANAIKQANESIYKKIGEIFLSKMGKEAAGVSTAEEQAKIEELKLKLQ